MIDQYDWAGGREAMLRFGPDTGPVVILALPLFEEANRTRTFAVTMLRALAERGLASALPDLPGQGESLIPLEEVRLSIWQHAIKAVATAFGDRPVHVASIRSGALLTHTATAASRWLFAPQGGGALTRDLLRAKQVAEGIRHDAAIEDAGPTMEIAGNVIPRTLFNDLRDAIPDKSAPSRIVRLATDAAEADRKVVGAPLWRRSEPGSDLSLAQILAADIADWIATCAS